MNPDLNNLSLPKLTESIDTRVDTQTEAEDVLARLKVRVDSRCDGHIFLLNTKTNQLDESGSNVLNYAVYLNFAGKNGFSLRLLELTCRQSDGNWPVNVSVFLRAQK